MECRLGTPCHAATSTADSGKRTIEYTRGLGLIKYTDGTNTKYYTRNRHGDTNHMIDAATATLANTYKYDAYGNQESISAEDTNPFRYSGEYYDHETGFIYLRARYYDSTNGRFISEDPARDGANWYAYCAGNPVNYVDPWGLATEALREMVEAIGGKIEWDEEKKRAIVTFKEKTVSFYANDNEGTFIGKDNTMYVDGAIFAQRFGAEYSEIENDAIVGYIFEYNNGRNNYVRAESFKIKKSIEGANLANDTNDAYNEHFSNQLDAIGWFSAPLSPNIKSLTAVEIAFDGVFEIMSNVDVSPGLTVEDRIVTRMEAGWSSSGRAAVIYTTIIKDKYNRVKSRSSVRY